MTRDTGEFSGTCPTCHQPYCWTEIARLRGVIYRNCDPMVASDADAKIIDEITVALKDTKP